MDELSVEINSILNAHQPTSGMQVAMGATCACGYWTGDEQAGVNRPIGSAGDQLNWHRSQLIADFVKGVK